MLLVVVVLEIKKPEVVLFDVVLFEVMLSAEPVLLLFIVWFPPVVVGVGVDVEFPLLVVSVVELFPEIGVGVEVGIGVDIFDVGPVVCVEADVVLVVGVGAGVDVVVGVGAGVVLVVGVGAGVDVVLVVGVGVRVDVVL